MSIFFDVLRHKSIMIYVVFRCLKKFGSWFQIFTTLGYKFGHLMDTTWSSES